uniref:Peripheral-type benzodiazepine receptor-associated protein 1 n=1 Tax=Schistocephalus solidus TaxID=70667 RepID=A0A0X3NQ50_SCHSO
METLLQDLRVTSERRKQLFLTNTEIKAQLSDKIGQLSRVLSSSATEAPRITTTELEEAIESLKRKLRESERHCTLESLRYEELLLDIESSQMRQRRNELGSILLEKPSMQSNSTDKSPQRDLLDLIKPTKYIEVHSSTNNQGIDQDESARDDLDEFPNNDEWITNRRVPAPRCIALEKQMVHSVIISWKSPEFTANNHEEVTAYHVYADGQFRTSVGDHEKLRALVDDIDASRQHRICVRTVTARGQSKDAECTLLVGKGATATPSCLKASHITTNSAKLSWLPGSSNFYHAIYLNDHELRVCQPGVHKIFLTGLQPDTLQRVRVEARRKSTDTVVTQRQSKLSLQSPVSPDEHPKNSVVLEFRTAPIGLPDPPKNVQIDAGPQDGVLLVSWRPVPQVTQVIANYENEPLVQGYSVCINGHLFEEIRGGAKDHVLLSLEQLAKFLRSASFQSKTSSQQDMSTLSVVNVPSTVDETSGLMARLQLERRDIKQDQENVSDHTDPETALELWLTVHSTVSASAVAHATATGPSRAASNGLLKDAAAGPASPPIRLLPNLLLISAGSLEAAIEIFGLPLCRRLGLNEKSAAVACVNLRRRQPVTIEIERPGMDAERSDNADSGDETTSVLHVDAAHISPAARTSSPTSDALDSAEALLRERKLQQYSFSDSFKHSDRNSHCNYFDDRKYQSARGISPLRHSSLHSSYGLHSKRPYMATSGYTDCIPRPYSLSRPHVKNYPDSYGFDREGRSLRPTRSMSDDNENPSQKYFYSMTRESRSQHFPSTESTESEIVHDHQARALSSYRIHHLNHMNPRVLARIRPFGPARSSFDIRQGGRIFENDLDYPYRLSAASHPRRHACRLHKAPAVKSQANLGTYVPGMGYTMRRSKSLGRGGHLRPSRSGVNENAFISCLSSSSNDEGVSRAYFERLGRVGQKSRFPIGLTVPQSISRSRSVSPHGQSRHHRRNSPYRWTMHERPSRRTSPDVSSGHDDGYSTRDHLKARRSPTERRSIRRWLHKMASVPEISVSKNPLHAGQKAVKDGTQESKISSENDACLFVAMYSYDPATMSPNPGAVNDELPFREGQVIRVYGECDEDGFYFGECNGKRGLVPSNMVRAVQNNEVPTAKFTSQHQRMRRGSAGASERRIPPGQIQASQTLNQSRSQKCRLGGKKEEGLKNQGRSLIPHNREHTNTERRPTGSYPSRNKNTPGPEGPKLGGHGQSGVNVSQQLSGAGQDITEIKRRPFFGPSDDETMGSYWQQKPANRHKMHRKRIMEALFDYNPQLYSPNVDVQNELPFCAGDRVLVFGEMDEDGFYFGQLESGRRGLVPSNFLKEVEYRNSNREEEGASRKEKEEGSDFDDETKLTEDIRPCGDDLSGCESESSVNGRISGPYTSQSQNQQKDKASTFAGQSQNVLGYQSPPPVPQGKLKQRRQGPLTGIEAGRQSAFPKKHASLPRGSQKRGHLSDMKEERLLEEESMIALTVPPASDWSGSPVQSNERKMPVQQAKIGNSNQSQETAHLRKSDESDKESVIIMDICSSNNRKSCRKASLSRLSSNEAPEPATSRRRSVFRSPFKKDSGHS